MTSPSPAYDRKVNDAASAAIFAADADRAMDLARRRLNALRVGADLDPLAEAYVIDPARVGDILSGKVIDQYGYLAPDDDERHEDPVAQLMVRFAAAVHSIDDPDEEDEPAADPAPLLPDHRHEQGYPTAGSADDLVQSAAAMGLPIEAVPSRPGTYRVIGKVPKHLAQPPASLEAHGQREEFKRRWAEVSDRFSTGATLFVGADSMDALDWVTDLKPQSHRHTTAGPDWEISPGEVPATRPGLDDPEAIMEGFRKAGWTVVNDPNPPGPDHAADLQQALRVQDVNDSLRAMKANPPADGRPVARLHPVSQEGVEPSESSTLTGRVTFDGPAFFPGALDAALREALDKAPAGVVRGPMITGEGAVGETAYPWPGFDAINRATALAELNAQMQEMAGGFAIVSGQRPEELPPLLELPPTENVAELVTAARRRTGFDRPFQGFRASRAQSVLVPWPGKSHLVVDRESTPDQLRVGGQAVIFNGSHVVPMLDPLRPDLIGSAFDAQGRMVLVYRHALDLAAAELRDARDPSGWDKGTCASFQLDAFPAEEQTTEQVPLTDDLSPEAVALVARAAEARTAALAEQAAAAEQSADDAAASVAAIPGVPTGVVPRVARVSPPAPAPVLDAAALPDLDATVAVNPPPPEAPVELETDDARRLRALAEINNVRARVGMKLHPVEGVENMPKHVCDRILSGLPFDQNGNVPLDDRPYDSVAIQTTEATALAEFNARMRHEGKPTVKALPRGCPFGPLIEAARLRHENNGELAYHVVLPSEANMRHNAAIELLDVERIACGYGPFASTDLLSLPPGATDNILAGLPFDRFGQPLDPKGGTDEVGARTLRKTALIELNEQRWDSGAYDGLEELPADADLKALVADAAARRALDEADDRMHDALYPDDVAPAGAAAPTEPAAPAPVDPKLGRIELPDEVTIAVLADPERAAAALTREFAPDNASKWRAWEGGEESAAPMTAGERVWQALDKRIEGVMMNLGALDVVRLQITPEEEEEAFRELFTNAKYGKLQVIEVADKPDETEILARLRRMMAPYLPAGSSHSMMDPGQSHDSPETLADRVSHYNLALMNEKRRAAGQPLFRLLPGYECVCHGPSCFELRKKAGTPARDTLSEFVRGNLGKPWVGELNAEIEQQDQTIAPAGEVQT